MIVCTHVAAPAARSRRDHCFLWTRVATAAAGRRLPVHLQLEDVGSGSSLLDSPIELEELYRTVQQRVDGVHTWNVQVYSTAAFAALREFPSDLNHLRPDS